LIGISVCVRGILNSVFSYKWQNNSHYSLMYSYFP